MNSKRPPLTAAVKLIIALNILIFGLWIYATSKNSENIALNLVVSWDGLLEGRIWTLITSAFSHNLFWHLLINMYILSGFGMIIERVLGFRRFLNFYLIAGVFSSFSHCLVSRYVLDQPDIPALGASGAIAGVVMLFSFLFPREKILMLGIIPVPAIVGALLFIGIDLWGLSAQAHGHGLPIGHGAHLGGAGFGILYYLTIVRNNKN